MSHRIMISVSASICLWAKSAACIRSGGASPSRPCPILVLWKEREAVELPKGSIRPGVGREVQPYS